MATPQEKRQATIAAKIAANPNYYQEVYAKGRATRERNRAINRPSPYGFWTRVDLTGVSARERREYLRKVWEKTQQGQDVAISFDFKKISASGYVIPIRSNNRVYSDNTPLSQVYADVESYEDDDWYLDAFSWMEFD